MDVIEFSPDRDQYAFTFGGVTPVRKVQPGTMLRLWTDDAFCGDLRDPGRHAQRQADDAVRQPATGPFYVEGASRGHARAAHRGPQPGARLGRVQHHSPVRRSDGHGPHRHAAGSTGGADLDLRGGPGPAHRSVPGPGQRPAAGATDGPDAGHGGRRPRPRARCGPRWSPTRSAETWTPPRCGPAPAATSGSTCRARCSPSVTASTGKARAVRGTAVGVRGGRLALVTWSRAGDRPGRDQTDDYLMVVGSAGRWRTPGGSARLAWSAG